MRRWILVFAVALQIATLITLSGSTGVAAQGSQTFNFPAGQVCWFPLTVTAEGGQAMTRHVWGRTIFAGTGANLTFTNEPRGKSVTYKSREAANQFISNANGTTTANLDGWNAVLLFPTDNSGGTRLAAPGAYIIVGRAVINIAAGDVFTMQSVEGRVTNVCTTLSWFIGSQ